MTQLPKTVDYSVFCLDLCYVIFHQHPVFAGIGLCMVLHPRKHSIGYTGDGFYSSKDQTNSIKVLKESFLPATWRYMHRPAVGQPVRPTVG